MPPQLNQARQQTTIFERLGFSFWPPAHSLVLCLAVWLAILVDPLRRFAPGSSIGGPVLGALIESLTLVPDTNKKQIISTNEQILTGMGIGRCST